MSKSSAPNRRDLMPEYGPDYHLVWPIEIFRSEAFAAAESSNTRMLEQRGARLLLEAMAGPQPARDFERTGPGAAAWNADTFTATARFLRELGDDADNLPKKRRQYWRERKTPAVPQAAALTELSLQDQWNRLVTEFDDAGYFDLMCPSACADGPSQEQREEEMSRRLTLKAQVPVDWPIAIPAEGMPVDDFYTYVEVVHDCISRPRQRTFHSYGDDWHYEDFATEPGQALYRWKVNRLFAQTAALDLRLAEDGEDIGLLVHVTDEARNELTHRILTGVTDPSSDPVARAVTQFRSRGANRQDKKDACRALAHELEGIRDRVKEHLLSRDEGMLFETANKFALRHNRADQHDDYADEYLDWLYWTYLSTIELMGTLARRGGAEGSL